MAVSTANDALLDLGEYRAPAPSADHLAYRHGLGAAIDVIELKNGQIGLAAIDTRRAAKVVVQEQQNVLLLEVHLGHRALDVVGLVAFIVTPPVRRLAPTAVVGPETMTGIPKWELPQCLELTAP